MDIKTTNGLDRNGKVKLAVIAKDLEYIKEDVKQILEKLELNYVTQIEFKPVRLVVYSIVGLLLTTIIGALVRFVFIS